MMEKLHSNFYLTCDTREIKRRAKPRKRPRHDFRNEIVKTRKRRAATRCKDGRKMRLFSLNFHPHTEWLAKPLRKMQIANVKHRKLPFPLRFFRREKWLARSKFEGR